MTALKTLAVAAALAAVAIPAKADDLSAQITKVGKYNFGEWSEALIVVTNNSDRSYARTEWSCQYRDSKNELVGQDEQSVTNVLPKNETAKQFHAHSFAPIASSECRLIGGR